MTNMNYNKKINDKYKENVIMFICINIANLILFWSITKRSKTESTEVLWV